MARWLPAAVAVVLALPGFGFTWLWDDFDFIGRVMRFRPSFLLPDPSVVFYRPLSRELVFGVMWLAGGGSPIAGHVVNALVLAVAVAFVASLVAELATPRAGILGGLAFASLGAAPLLVAWASGIQDLLAILFAVASLRFALRGRTVAAAAALCAGALSKETALAILPVVAALPWILNRGAKRTGRALVPFLVVAVGWVALAPGARALLAKAGGGGTGSDYISVGGMDAPSSLIRTAITLLNAPVPGSAGGGFAGKLAAGLAALALLAAAVWLSSALGDAGQAQERTDVRRVALLAGVLAVAPSVLTSVFVRNWSPYYAAFPMIGVAALIGLLLDRQPRWTAALFLPLYLVIGLWTRGASPGATVPCEVNFSRASLALRDVEAGFKRLYPTLPHRAQALVSVASTGALGVDLTMHRFQALRVWYKDPSIVTRSPEAYESGEGEVFLFRVIPTLDVVEIDPERFLFRSSGAHPDPTEVSRPARTYVRAVAADGDPLRAAQFQLRIARLGRGPTRDYDLRLAAMYLLIAGRRDEARPLLDSLPPIPRSEAVPMIKKIYAESPPRLNVRPFAFGAFGLPESDLEGQRELMRLLQADGNLPLAAAVARVILDRSHSDPEALAVVLAFEHYRPPERIRALPVMDPSEGGGAIDERPQAR